MFDKIILLCYNIFEVKGRNKALSQNIYKGEMKWEKST